jgi:hypothetical protein
MTTRRLDDRMKRLLREIRNGKKVFNINNYPKEAFMEFNMDVKCLIQMKSMGLIPYNKLHVQESHDTSNREYLVAIVDGLSYEGELAANELELAPATETLAETLSHQGLQACRQDFARAVTTVAPDPAQAIASASSTLESVCKKILSQYNRPLPKKQSLNTLLTETTQALRLAPEDAAEAEIRRILGAVGNIGSAVGTLRTKYGSAHGRANDHTPLDPVHARFAINSMAAVALFLLENAIDSMPR